MINVFFFLFQMTTGIFYSKRKPQTQWVAPATGADSDVEIELNEEDVDDDTLDPDYLLCLSDDEIPVPSTSKKSSKYNNCFSVFGYIVQYYNIFM